MTKFLKGVFEHSKEYREIQNSLKEGVSPLYVYGLESQYSAMFAQALIQKSGGLIVTPGEHEAKAIYDVLNDFTNDVLLFPAREMEFFEVFAESHTSEIRRSDVINRLVENGSRTVVASIDSISRSMAPMAARAKAVSLKYGEAFKLDDLLSALVEMGFARADMVESPGQFSVRGGIIDVFPVEVENPARIEFFGDEIDSIRTFDVTNQISIEKISSVIIAPCAETIVTIEEAESFSSKLRNIADTRKDIISERLHKGLLELSEKLENGIVSSEALDRFSSVLYDKSSSIMDYFSKDAKVVFIDPARIGERGNSLKKDFLFRFNELYESGNALAEQEKWFFDFDEFRYSIAYRQVMAFDMLKKDPKIIAPAEIVHISTTIPSNFYSRAEILKEEIENWKYRGYKVLISVSSPEKARRLADSLSELGSVSTVMDSVSDSDYKVMSGQSVIFISDLETGLVFSSFKTVFLTEKDIYGTAYVKKNKKKSSKERVIRSFSELSEGDLVVHESHGIGRYVGIDQLKIDGATKDFLKIRYGGEDSLYIPVEQMDILQKYIGADEGVKLSKLGGAQWKLAKSKARKSVEDITDDLVKLYAERKSTLGHEFSKDTEWQKQFEDAFPYVETDDQLKCIEEIKNDMEMPQVMDRLLCGDVGYGKTEVALRAIFKAVNDSKQAAVLVPTTILAQQHYSNMIDRFSKFPIKIEMLSRFRTKKQQEKIIQDIKDGVIDIIVGTHRILSPDIKFKDMGLLVVDEEQRFGVKHKEAIKKLKAGVDVLTMTATPIPRTLHMSLSGVRDMSVIEDPPEDRFPIQTFVAEYDDEIVKEAILRESTRGGQVFFVHNQVKDIDVIAGKLSEMLPDLDIRYAHGQMNEGRLEKIMVDFINKEFDVLVATTIIETGLDISNANTIIINNADKMGLSQLYQLRGRVGRSNRIAYAYLLYKKDKSLSEIAEKRLKAIKEFTELGAGFRIAMRDLELRGAGNLLGSEQHGHVASVGYELYCQMIEDAVLVIKGEPPKKESVDTLIELSIDAYIPDNLITVGEHKLDMYKRIAGIRTRGDIDRVEEEIEDRYGDLPRSVKNLTLVSYLRSLGQASGALSVSQDGKGLVVKLAPDAPINPTTIIELVKMYGARFKLVPGGKPYIRIIFDMSKIDEVELLNQAIILMETIVDFTCE